MQTIAPIKHPSQLLTSANYLPSSHSQAIRNRKAISVASSTPVFSSPCPPCLRGESLLQRAGGRAAIASSSRPARNLNSSPPTRLASNPTRRSSPATGNSSSARSSISGASGNGSRKQFHAETQSSQRGRAATKFGERGGVSPPVLR